MTKPLLLKVPGLSMSRLTTKLLLRLTAAPPMRFSKLCSQIPRWQRSSRVAKLKPKRFLQVSFAFQFFVDSWSLGVLAPYSVKCLLNELGEQPFSISTDASNHKEIKLFPLVILGQRFTSASLPPCQHYFLNSTGQCFRGACLLLVQSSVDRLEEFTSSANSEGSPSSASQLRHWLCWRSQSTLGK